MKPSTRVRPNGMVVNVTSYADIRRKDKSDDRHKSVGKAVGKIRRMVGWGLLLQQKKTSHKTMSFVSGIRKSLRRNAVVIGLSHRSLLLDKAH